MNITELITLLDNADDINQRSEFYRTKLSTQVHPLFLEIIGNYNQSTLLTENNSELAQIRLHLEDSVNRIIQEDLSPIGIILTQKPYYLRQLIRLYQMRFQKQITC